MLHTSEIYEAATSSAGIGIIGKDVEVDWEKVQGFRAGVVEKLTSGVKALLRLNKVTSVSGEAVFTGPKTVKVGGKELTAEKVIICSGSYPIIPGIPGLKESKAVIDSTACLSLPAIPESMVVIGGGVIGLELGSVYRRYGAPPLGNQEGIYNESPEVSFSLPFSVGVGFQWNLSPKWALGTGIRYTNLQRTVVGNYKGDGFYLEQTDIDNRQHWIGVPVNVYYNFINKGRWNVHAFAGGGVEWLLDNHYLIHNNPSDIHYHQPKNGIPQFSAGAGLGVEFKITPVVGLYLDPSFRYFFATQKQPRSLRTVQPLRFDIEAGVRFSFGK